MAFEVLLPDENPSSASTKDLVFSVLAEGKHRTLTQIHRELKSRFGVSVSFQAVIKAVRSLSSSGVLERSAMLYSLRKEWIFEAKRFFDKVYMEHFKVKRPMKATKVVGGVRVFTVNNLLELDTMWNDLLVDWASHERKDKRNVWRGMHCWWLLPRLQEEDLLHDFLLKYKVETYNVITGSTKFDRWALKYYSEKGIRIRIDPKAGPVSWLNVTSFGDNYMKFEIPAEVGGQLDAIYRRARSMEDIDLKKVMDIFKRNCEMQVVVINDSMLAEKLKEEIIARFGQ